MKIPGLDSLKGAIFEDEPEQTTPEAVVTWQPIPDAIPDVAAPVNTVETNSYRYVLNFTDFASTKAGKALDKYMPTLIEAVGQDKAFEAALKLAKRNDGLTETDVAEAFAELRSSLQQLNSDATKKAAAFKADKIDAVQAKIDTNTAVIEAKQSENEKLLNDLSSAQGKFKKQQSEFNAAVVRRTAELQREEQEKTASLRK